MPYQYQKPEESAQDKFKNRYNNWPGTGTNSPAPRPGTQGWNNPASQQNYSPFMPQFGAVDSWAGAGGTGSGPAFGGFALPDVSGAVNNLASQTAGKINAPPGSLEGPGTGEQAWSQYGGAFWQPWEAEKAYQGMDWQSLYNQSQNAPTYNADALKQFMPQGANMGAYYDRAWDTGSKRLNNEFAARGAYNSGAATQQLSDLAANLGAQQSRDEAQYGLDRARVGSMLSQAASGEARSTLGDQMSVLQGQLGAASDADRAKLARLGGGLSGAFTSQSAEEGRNRGELQDIFGVATGAGNVFQQGLADALAADAEFMAKPYEAQLAVLQTRYNMSKEQAENMMGIISAGAQVAGAAINKAK